MYICHFWKQHHPTVFSLRCNDFQGDRTQSGQNWSQWPSQGDTISPAPPRDNQRYLPRGPLWAPVPVTKGGTYLSWLWGKNVWRLSCSLVTVVSTNDWAGDPPNAVKAIYFNFMVGAKVEFSLQAIWKAPKISTILNSEYGVGNDKCSGCQNSWKLPQLQDTAGGN